METIVWRLILVLSILGIVLGVPAMYMGSAGLKNWPRTLQTMQDESQKRFKDCMANPEVPSKQVCADAAHDELMSALDIETKGYKSADKLTTYGFLLAVVMPIALYALFYIFRWILTGRWRTVRADVETRSGSSRS